MKRIELIRSDLYRYTGRISIKNFVFVYLTDYGFRRRVFFRLVQGKTSGLFQKIYMLTRGRIQISSNTSIGYGLYIGHSGPVVINPAAVIGNKVNISQFVTIGSNDNKAAHIGDRVYLGPSVCVVEDVVIGNDTIIGAGAVVTKDIPEGTTAAGNYAKVIGVNKHREYIQNLWQVLDHE